jgi:phage-related protein
VDCAERRQTSGAKALSGFGGAGVLEVIEDYRGDTFRAVYTLTYADVVFMLHAFQKKSKTGRETPRRDIELIKQRLRAAERIAKEMMP